MATIEPHAFFTSSNLAEQTVFVPPAVAAASPAAYLDASDGRYIKLLRGLPKQRRHDGLGLSVGLRHTLKALIEYQCQCERPYQHEQGVVATLAQVAEYNCYTPGATRAHLNALAAAGWLSIGDGDEACQQSYKLSAALEMYAELASLEKALGADDDQESQLKIAQMTTTLSALLARNRAAYELRGEEQQQAKRLARNGLGAKVIALAMKIAARDRAGLGIAYQLREQIGLCLPFLGPLAATPGDSPDAAELSPAPLPASGEGTPEGGEHCELVDLASASNRPPPLPPGEASAQHKALEQRGVKLRNEMLSLACHIDKERLVPEVLEFTRSKPSLEALQKRLDALKRLARCAQR